MTTQIKFRGFRVDGKGWVEGDLLHGQGAKMGKMYILLQQRIIPKDADPIDGYKIYPSSLGQFTGQIDKNGKEIFGAIGEKGGDVVDTPKGNAPVTFELGCFYVITRSRYRLGGWNSDCIEIIGNQFEQDNGR